MRLKLSCYMIEAGISNMVAVKLAIYSNAMWSCCYDSMTSCATIYSNTMRFVSIYYIY